MALISYFDVTKVCGFKTVFLVIFQAFNSVFSTFNDILVIYS